jgi:hypothetical protein
MAAREADASKTIDRALERRDIANLSGLRRRDGLVPAVPKPTHAVYPPAVDLFRE